MCFCSTCNLDYMNPIISIPEYDKPIKDEENKDKIKCILCGISIKPGEWKRHLNSVSHNLKKHIITYHKALQDLNNKGNKPCEICNVKVDDMFKHKMSSFHRFNQDFKSVILFHSVSDFVDHINCLKNEKEIEDILKPNEENIFWITAREELDDEQYNQLKGELIGRQRKSKIRRKR